MLGNRFFVRPSIHVYCSGSPLCNLKQGKKISIKKSIRFKNIYIYINQFYQLPVLLLNTKTYKKVLTLHKRPSLSPKGKKRPLAEGWSPPIQLVSCDVHESSVFAITETPLPGGLETSGRRAYRYYWHTSRYLGFLPFQWFLAILNIFQVFGICKPAYCA